MPSEEAIQQELQQILHPDIECTIESDIPTRLRTNCTYTTLAQLIDIAVEEENHTPYIQLQDNKGQWLYNNTLTIENRANLQVLEDHSYHYRIDCITDITNKEQLHYSLLSGNLADQQSIVGHLELDPYLPIHYNRVLDTIFENDTLIGDTILDVDRTLHIQLRIHKVNPLSRSWVIHRATATHHVLSSWDNY